MFRFVCVEYPHYPPQYPPSSTAPPYSYGATVNSPGKDKSAPFPGAPVFASQQQAHVHPVPPPPAASAPGSAGPILQRTSAFTQTQTQGSAQPPRPTATIDQVVEDPSATLRSGVLSENFSKAFSSPKSSGLGGPTSAESTTPIPFSNDLPPSIPSPDM